MQLAAAPTSALLRFPLFNSTLPFLLASAPALLLPTTWAKPLATRSGADSTQLNRQLFFWYYLLFFLGSPFGDYINFSFFCQVFFLTFFSTFLNTLKQSFLNIWFFEKENIYAKVKKKSIVRFELLMWALFSKHIDNFFFF